MVLLLNMELSDYPDLMSGAFLELSVISAPLVNKDGEFRIVSLARGE